METSVSAQPPLQARIFLVALVVILLREEPAAGISLGWTAEAKHT